MHPWVVMLVAVGLSACSSHGPEGSFVPASRGDAGRDADKQPGAGGDSAGAGGASLDPEPEQASATLGPEGGELALGSFATLLIPEGALSAATEITLRRLHHMWWEPEDQAVSIEPLQLSFDPPAELRIDTRARPAPVPWLAPHFDFHPTVDAYDRGDVARTYHDGDVASVSVPTTGAYVLLWEARGIAGGCPAVPDTFEACGGDPSGDWERLGYCYAGLRSIVVAAPDREQRCSHDLPATVDLQGPVKLLVNPISEWPMDGSLEIAGGLATFGAATALVPLVSDIGDPADATCSECEQLNPILAGAECTAGARCTCSFSVPERLPAREVPMMMSASELLFQGESPREFCQSGDRLMIRDSDDVGPWIELFERRRTN